MRTFSATDAKNNFGAVLESLSFEPVEIVKNGKVVAVMVSAHEFEEMEDDYAMTKAKAKLVTHDPQTIETLTKYSTATISSGESMKRLGLKFQGQLLDLLGMTNLPFPSLPTDRINSMVSELLQEEEKNG